MTENNHADDMTSLFGEPVHIYTRDQAVQDGVLVPLSGDLTREAGFVFPIDMTAAACAQTIRWGQAEQAANPAALQDETGRAWDVLTMLGHAMRGRRAGRGDRIPFEVLVVPADTTDTDPQLVQLHAVFTTDDNDNHVLVLTQPHED